MQVIRGTELTQVFIDEADTLPAIHSCALCSTQGRVPKDMLWTWDVPAQPICRSACPETTQRG